MQAANLETPDGKVVVSGDSVYLWPGSVVATEPAGAEDGVRPMIRFAADSLTRPGTSKAAQFEHPVRFVRLNFELLAKARPSYTWRLDSVCVKAPLEVLGGEDWKNILSRAAPGVRVAESIASETIQQVVEQRSQRPGLQNCGKPARETTTPPVWPSPS